MRTQSPRKSDISEGEQLVPNVLLTSKPIALVRRPPSLFDFLFPDPARTVAQFLKAHGYRVIELKLAKPSLAGMSHQDQMLKQLSAHMGISLTSELVHQVHWAFVPSAQMRRLFRSSISDSFDVDWVRLSPAPLESLSRVVSLAESEWR